MRRHTLPLLLASLAAAACTPSDGSEAGTPAADTAAAAPAAPADAPQVAAWRTNPADGATVTPAGAGDFTLQAGPHVIAWAPDAAELAPPYTVRATLEKTTGRIHEGTGLLFGGTGLEGPESEQSYSYFLTRGDGSFLIKQRQGDATPVVRDWTTHPAIRRDTEGAGRPNELRVEVGTEETVFFANGAEVARAPTAELQVEGRAGIRAAHDVVLRVAGFQAGAGSPTP